MFFANKFETWIYTAAVALRVLLLFYIAMQFGNDLLITPFGDGPKYFRLATSIVEGQGFVDSEISGLPESMRPPGYPLFEAFFLWLSAPLWAAVIVQILVVSWAPIVAMRLARLFALPSGMERLTGYFMAFEPLQILYSTTLSSDSFGMFLFLLGTYYLARFWQEKDRMALGLAAFCFGFFNYFRSLGIYLGFLIAFLLFCCGIARLRPWREMRFGATVFVIIFSALLLPWMLRNYVTFGSFAFTSALERHLYDYLGSALVAARDKITFEEARTKTLGEIKPFLPEPDDLYSFKNSEVFRARAIPLILGHKKELVKLYPLAWSTFFLSGNYHYLGYRLGFIEKPQEGFQSFTLLFVSASFRESWDALARFIKEPYGLVALLGRVFWVALFVGSCYGAIRIWRRYPSARFLAILYALLVLYSSVLVVTTLGGLEARHRLFLNPFIFLFASAGIYFVIESWHARRRIVAQVPSKA